MGVTVRRRKDKPGWWMFVNHQGTQYKKYFGSNKKLALEVAGQVQARLKLGEFALPSASSIRLNQYAEAWLQRIRQTRKESTCEDYKKMLKADILPLLGELNLKAITREKVKALAHAGLTKGQAPKTVQNAVRCLSSLLSHALEDGLIMVNPALRPGKFLPKVSKKRAINPWTREEAALFLDTVQHAAPNHYPLFLCALRTGLRQGELIALQWQDIDYRSRSIEVRRSYSRGKLTTPKSGESRHVDMSLALTQAFKDSHAMRQLEAVANGWSDPPVWVFCDRQGKPLFHNTLRKLFHRLTKAAGVRPIRFHDLRHTFASLLLRQGESPVYVKEQLGHASIQITVDCYGHLIPGTNKQAVDRLDSSAPQASLAPSGGPQADPRIEQSDLWGVEPLDSNEDDEGENGVSDGLRTRDLLSHSQAL